MKRATPRAGTLLACRAVLVVAATFSVTSAALPAGAAYRPNVGLRPVEVWSVTLPDAGHPIALSSPNLATLAGHPAVVVGDRAGYLYALSLATGRPVPGWPASTGGIPIDSTPSVAALSPGSPDDSVFVGVGNAADPGQGGYEALSPTGSALWFVAVKNPLSDHSAGATAAVQASLAVGELQGSIDVVGPSLSQEEYALNAATGAVLPGFPWFTADDDFSTPALADLYGNGHTQIIEGGDSSPGISYGVRYVSGGHLRVIAPTGRAGTDSPTGGLDCEYNADQVMESSPAVGPFLARGATGVVLGTGDYWKGASQTNQLMAFNARCQPAWSDLLDGDTESSPALVGIDGQLAVIEGTRDTEGGGSVYALSGATGSVLWRQPLPAEIIGSVVAADLGQGHQDVIAPTTDGAYVLDARTGRILAALGLGTGLQNSPLVTDDPNGTIGVTIAGYNGHDQGTVLHFELPGTSGKGVDGPGSWPMFHHDPQLTGTAGPV